jgi:hypothetical protein
MERLRRIGRDPLVHFLIPGALLFALNHWLNPPDSRSAEVTTIVVDEPTLINFMQYRSQAFEPAYFVAAYQAMSPAERKQLVDTYVREEAMAREARAMGLDGADYVIRQRLLQKMLFLIDGAAEDATAPNDKELKAWFESHAGTYANPEEVTFTHVFIDDEVAHPGGGQAEAARVKAQLVARRAGFNDAPQYGDRFPYLVNYVGRSFEFVTNQLGAEFAGGLAKLQPSPAWQGPVRSQFGWHLVLLTKRQQAGSPDFASVRDQVLADYQSEQAGKARDVAIAELLEQYDVEVKLPEGALPAGSK